MCLQYDGKLKSTGTCLNETFAKLLEWKSQGIIQDCLLFKTEEILNDLTHTKPNNLSKCVTVKRWTVKFNTAHRRLSVQGTGGPTQGVVWVPALPKWERCSGRQAERCSTFHGWPGQHSPQLSKNGQRWWPCKAPIYTKHLLQVRPCTKCSEDHTTPSPHSNPQGQRDGFRLIHSQADDWAGQLTPLGFLQLPAPRAHVLLHFCKWMSTEGAEMASDSVQTFWQNPDLTQTPDVLTTAVKAIIPKATLKAEEEKVL